MQQNNQDMDISKDEISLFDIFSFLGDNLKMILVIGFAGTMVSGGYLVMVPSQYEANALFEMAQVRSSGNSNINPATSIEAPALLIERLRSPSTYTPESIRACGLEDEPSPAEAMVKIVKTILPKNLISVVSISVRRSSPELAKQCVDAVFEMVRSQQAGLVKAYQGELANTLAGLQSRLRTNQDFVSKTEKAGLYQTTVYLAQRDEMIHLVQEIDELQRALSRNSQTRLVSPVYASPNKVSPLRTQTLALGT